MFRPRSIVERGALITALAAAFTMGIVGSARAETLTWAQVKERAARQSPAAVRGLQATRAARADAAGAGRWPRTNPVLSGGVDTGAPFGSADDRNLSVKLEQELDVVGVAAAGARAGGRKVAVAEQEAAVLRLDGLAEAAEAFVELDRAQRALAIWIDLDKSFRSIAEGTLRAATAGEKSDLDAILAGADSAGATADLTQALTEIARARARLGLLVAAADPASLRVEVAEAVPPPDSRTADELAATAMRRRLEVTLWQARRAEAEARQSLAFRSMLPRPTIGLGLSNERFEEGREASPGNPGGLAGFRQNSTILQLTLSVPLPLFDTNQAERARAAADARTAHEEAEISAREIRGAVMRAKAAVDTSWTALQRWQIVEPKLAEAQTLLAKGFSSGQVDLLTTLAGAERVARARVRALEGRTNYLKARAELSRALGEEP